MTLMEPARPGRRHNLVLVDTSDIHAFGIALTRHADDLRSVAADLTAAQVSADAFGSVGSGFVAALNDALSREAARIERLAARLASATFAAGSAADAYTASDDHVGQSISEFGH
jgi:hypothetical protein